MIVTACEDFAAAWRWRRLWGYGGRGVVVVYGAEVHGWVYGLRNPGHWPPGYIAIDGDGRSWTAIGGDGREGALMWLPNDPLPD